MQPPSSEAVDHAIETLFYLVSSTFVAEITLMYPFSALILLLADSIDMRYVKRPASNFRKETLLGDLPGL